MIVYPCLLTGVNCSNLIPKANAWLLENIGVCLIKCETIEKKISSVDEINSDNVLFAASDGRAVFVKGLRCVRHLTTASVVSNNYQFISF